LNGLLGVVVEEGTDELVGVVDLGRVLSEDPDERRLGLWLVEFFERGAERRDDPLVPLRIFAEDVLFVPSSVAVSEEPGRDRP
jgi:CBS domain containing-hemolysin-like protein